MLCVFHLPKELESFVNETYYTGYAVCTYSFIKYIFYHVKAPLLQSGTGNAIHDILKKDHNIIIYFLFLLIESFVVLHCGHLFQICSNDLLINSLTLLLSKLKRGDKEV